MELCAGEHFAPFGQFLPSSGDAMLPSPILATAYMVFTVLASMTMMRCCEYRTWLPPAQNCSSPSSTSSNKRDGDSKSIKHPHAITAQVAAVRSPMLVALSMHFALYVVELGCTNMLCGYPSMAAHHVLSLFLFGITLYDPRYLCFPWVVPYWIHSVYWVVLTTMQLPEAEFWLLTSYNISLFVCAGVFFYYVRVHEDPNRSLTGPFTLFGIASVNYYVYCSPVYTGSVCLYKFDPYLQYLEGDNQVVPQLLGALAVMLPLVAGTCFVLEHLSIFNKAKVKS